MGNVLAPALQLMGLSSDLAQLGDHGIGVYKGTLDGRSLEGQECLQGLNPKDQGSGRSHLVFICWLIKRIQDGITHISRALWNGLKAGLSRDCPLNASMWPAKHVAVEYMAPQDSKTSCNLSI
ncbi:uncharacterized protein LOC144316098 [Canis aureus]